MTDSIHWRMGPSEPCRRGSSLRSGPQQPAAEVGDELLEVAAGEALVGDDRGAVELDAAQDLGGGVALGQVGREQVERDRHAVGRAQQHQPEAPEVAAVAAAVAVGRVAGKVRAPDGLARGSAWHRGGVQQPEGVAPRRRAAREDAEHERDLAGERPHALVVTRLLGQIREQMPEPLAREAQEPTLRRAAQQDLRDRQADQFRVGDRRAAPCTRPARQDLVGQHVKCRQKVVEVGDHAATSVVDVGVSNADLRRPFYLTSTRTAPPRGTESII
jgi:hypothetical protein